MTQTSDIISKIIQNLLNNWQFYIAICVIVAVLFFVIWIAFRRIRLWYWKVNYQANMLQNIDNKLDEINAGILRNIITAEKNVDSKQKVCFTASPFTETLCGEPENFETGYTPTSEAFTPAPRLKKFVTGSENISRNGTEYTEQQLEAQIKD